MSSELLELLERAKDPDNHPHLKSMEGFFREARDINSDVTDSAKEILSGFKPFLVVNRVRTKKDANAGGVIQNIMKQYLSIESAVIMTIREDNAVGNAIARMKPIMVEAPDSPFCRDIGEIALKLCELANPRVCASHHSITPIFSPYLNIPLIFLHTPFPNTPVRPILSPNLNILWISSKMSRSPAQCLSRISGLQVFTREFNT